MKIQCNVCEAAEATVLCCADEAALCWACDEKVHAANKLASKHQRVPLSTSHMPPNCDICQVLSPSVLCCLEIYICKLLNMYEHWVFFYKKKKFYGVSWQIENSTQIKIWIYNKLTSDDGF